MMHFIHLHSINNSLLSNETFPLQL